MEFNSGFKGLIQISLFIGMRSLVVCSSIHLFTC